MIEKQGAITSGKKTPDGSGKKPNKLRWGLGAVLAASTLGLIESRTGGTPEPRTAATPRAPRTAAARPGRPAPDRATAPIPDYAVPQVEEPIITRNPFRFAPERVPGAPTIGNAVPGTQIGQPRYTAGGGPGYGMSAELAGIARRDTTMGSVYTAVLTLDGVVHLAEAGDDIPGGYRVHSVGEDSVELTETGSGSRYRLMLR